MSPTPPRRSVLRTTAVAFAFAAGCLSVGDSADEPPPTDSVTESSRTVTPTAGRATEPPRTTPPTDGSTPVTLTSDPVGTGSNPTDLVVGNGTDVQRTLSVVVSKQTEQTVLEETVTLDPGEQRRWDVIPADGSGVYVVSVRLSNGPKRTYEWDLSERPGDGWLTVGVADDGTLTFTYAVA